VWREVGDDGGEGGDGDRGGGQRGAELRLLTSASRGRDTQTTVHLTHVLVCLSSFVNGLFLAIIRAIYDFLQYNTLQIMLKRVK